MTAAWRAWAWAVAACLVGGCADEERDRLVRLADDAVIAEARGPAVRHRESDDATLLGAPWRRLDGRAGWRYFRAANELGDGEVVGGGRRPAAMGSHEAEALYIPPGFGVATWLDVPPGARLALRADGSFDDETGLALTVMGMTTAAPPIPDRIEPGSLRRRMADERIGVARNLKSTRGGDSAALDFAPARDARSLLILASATGGRPETLRSLELHLLSPFPWLVVERRISDRLVADVDLHGVRHRSLVLTPGTTVVTRDVDASDAAELVFSLARPGDPVDGGVLRVSTRVGDADPRELVALEVAEPLGDWRPIVLRWPGGRRRITFSFEGKSGDELLAIGAPMLRPASDDARRIVLVSIDTLRADRLGCYGNERELTPNIDRLAREATLFERAYSHAPYTLPSHVSLFSGLSPDSHGVERSRDLMPDDLPLLSVELARAGYRTAAFTAGGYLSEAFGHGRGFDVYCEVDPLADRYFPGAVAGGDRLPGDVGSLSRALRFLTDPDDGRAYLLLHTFIVHCYLPPADLAARFGLTGDGAPPLTFEAARRFEPERVAADGLSADDARRMVDAYDATVIAADRMVGELRARLEESGLWDSTIVVVTSDHGQELLERGGAGHGVTLYDELIRVPLIIRVPGAASGRVSEQVRQIDVLPTLLELSGRPVPPAVEGESFAGVFRGASIRDRTVVARVDDPVRSRRRAIIHNGYKRIESDEDGSLLFRPIASRELYDLASDPHERDNLAARSASIEERLRERLGRHEADAARRRARWSSGGARAATSDDLEEALRQLGYAGGDDRRRE